ncbi:MAG: hypothetical protein EBU90_01935 [Proteobacteria bacterium]|nr:hypothetical protein [Pseudomonadota bacterium]NBP13241.1 hypothetical protein [bacterium]
MTLQYHLYLYSESTDKQRIKRLKKKITKEKNNDIEFQVYKGSFNENSIKCIRDVLHKVRKLRTKYGNYSTICIATDHINQTMPSRVPLPQLPSGDFQALFLEGTVETYVHLKNMLNPVWHKCKVKDSFFYLLNARYIDKYLDVLSRVKTHIEFLNQLDDTYIITGGLVPCERVAHQGITCTALHPGMCLSRFNSVYNNLSDEEKYVMLPKVTLICILTTVEDTFRTVYSFMKLDYPSDHLELIIIDTTSSEKELKKTLPADPRIKVIDAPESTSNNIGYLLNAGNRYATSEVRMHFFDQNVYFVEKFRDLVKIFLASNKECVVSNHTGVFDTTSLQSGFLQQCDLANLMYTQSFWMANPFKMGVSSHHIVNDFIKTRQNCVAYYPFLYGSYQRVSQYPEECTTLKVSLESLVDNGVKQLLTKNLP